MCMQKEFINILKKKKYHDFHVQSDTLFLADVFKHFRNMCLKTFDLDSSKNVFRALISLVSSFKKE